MVRYVTLGSNHLERSLAFYDGLLALLGATRLRDEGRMVIWGVGTQGMLAVCTPFDGRPASSGNGVMVALDADSPETVCRLHARAIELGGRDDGAPGPRGEGDFFGCYFRDPDGNKLCAFHLG